MVVNRGGYLASAETVEVDTKWKGLEALVGGEGGFMVHASGAGPLVVSSYGAIDRTALAAGERIVVDTGHMVAFPDDIDWKMRRAAEGRTLTSAKSGELFVYEVTGPGEILTQTRNFDGLMALAPSALTRKPTPAPDEDADDDGHGSPPPGSP